MIGDLVQAVGALVRRRAKGVDPDPDRILDHGDAVTLETDIANAPEVHFEDAFGRRTSHNDDLEEG